MKKLIALFLAAALCLMGLSALAEDMTVESGFKFADIGVTLRFPETFKDTKGLVVPLMANELATDMGIYVVMVGYVAMDRDVYAQISEKEEATEEETEQLQAAIVPLGVLIGIKDGVDTAGMMDDPLPEVGKGGDVTWYNAAESETPNIPDAAFAEEYAKLAAELPQVYAMSEFYAPQNPYAAMEGKHLDFTTADLDGNPVSAAELFSQHAYTAVNIWATWCHFCVEEMPELEALNERLKDIDCAVVGLLHDSAKKGKLEKGKAIIEEKGVHYTAIQAPEGVDDIFATMSFPTTYIVDREGNVVGKPIVGVAVQDIEARLRELTGK